MAYKERKMKEISLKEWQ